MGRVVKHLYDFFQLKLRLRWPRLPQQRPPWIPARRSRRSRHQNVILSGNRRRRLNRNLRPTSPRSPRTRSWSGPTRSERQSNLSTASWRKRRWKTSKGRLCLKSSNLSRRQSLEPTTMISTAFNEATSSFIRRQIGSGLRSGDLLRPFSSRKR